MDEYPAFSLDHNVPLLLTLGIASASAYESRLEPSLREQAVLIRSEAPKIESQQANALLRYVEERDASALPWNENAIGEVRRYRFRVRTAERTILLPPRRATLPENFEAPIGSVALHSPFSPLSPACHLYPDGLIDSQWIRKHQELVPSILLCFYSLTADPKLASRHDSQIKTDLNNIRALLSQSGYRTRLAVALLADQAPLSADGTHERLDNIRRACGIDPKALFLIAPPDQQQQQQQHHVERIAENMLTTLYGIAIEYYRDLGRHARKKRGRGYAPQPTVPPTTGTSQTLSLAGWNVRYDFKSAVLAEFRGEADAALRLYEQAYENLLGAELLEITPSWSPRWNEARLLADVVAVRHLRCLLCLGQPTAAVRKWQSHRDRVADFVDRRGRGTRNYGWAAWEARWATVMAHLMDRGEAPELTLVPSLSSPLLYLPPEKAVLGERLQPWELLHHPGYWHRLAARHLRARRAFARAIPEDDRRPPSFSPASRVASKAFAYDTYMCPDPHEELPLPLPLPQSVVGSIDGTLSVPNLVSGKGTVSVPVSSTTGVNHDRLIVASLARARAEFLKRRQLRLAAEVSLECARDLAGAGDWPGVVELLRPLWEEGYFRAGGWLDVAEELAWTLRAAAVEMGLADLLIALDWELMDKSFTTRQNWRYDITKSLDGIRVAPASKPVVQIDQDTMLSFLSASFIFRSDEGKAGQSTRAQLSITSNAHHGSSPVVLSRLHLGFEGSMRTIVLHHQSDETTTRRTLSGIVLSPVSWREDDPIPETEPTPDPSESLSTLQGDADLTLPPRHTVVFDMDIPLREPGEAMATSLNLYLVSDAFDLEHSSTLREGPNASRVWFISPALRKTVARPNPLVTRILPRPPKMEIKGVVLMDQYYTNEPIALEFDVFNAEDADATSKIDVVLFGEEPPSFDLVVSDGKAQGTSSQATEDEESKLSAIPLGTIASAESIRVRLRVKPIARSSRYDLTLRVDYHLRSDPQTPIAQTAVFFLNIVNPFEANYDLLPRANPDPWPSFFDPAGVPDVSSARSADDADEDEDGPARGLAQTWCLVTRYASFAAEDLRVVGLDVGLAASPAVRCRTVPQLGVPGAADNDDDGAGAGYVVRPKTIKEAIFDIVAHKRTLDDRGAVTLDAEFVIHWARLPGSGNNNNNNDADDGDAVINTTTLPVPRFNIFGTEPRVLASVSYLYPGSESDDNTVANKSSTTATATASATRLLVLDVTIENASHHFLTFGVSMEPNDQYAFSGPKQTTLNVLPVSRRRVTYRLLPLVSGARDRDNNKKDDVGSNETGEQEDEKEEEEEEDQEDQGAWIRPALTVRDKYFQKVLRVIPTQGMQMDKDGFLIWVPPEGGVGG